MKSPAPQSARGFRKLREIHSSSLAVFYVEQVALNRHDQSMSKITRAPLSHNEAMLSTRIRSLRFADCPASVIKTVETYHLLTNNVSRSAGKAHLAKFVLQFISPPFSC